MNLCEIAYYKSGEDFPEEKFGRHLAQLIDQEMEENKKSKVLYLCIGSDRSTGDSLGPLIGYMLQKEEDTPYMVFGSLSQPVHAVNLNDTLELLESRYQDAVVIAIDASVGKREQVGSISLGRGSLKPGLGVKKDLAAVGDIFITGVVGVCGHFEPLLLQNTRLAVVMELADCICRGICRVENFLLSGAKS